MTRKFDWPGVRTRLAEAERLIEAPLEPTPDQVARVCQQRAVKLAQRPPSLLNDAEEPVLVFSLSGERYSLPLDQVAEVLPLRTLTPVPGLPNHIAGIINVRTEIRPVVSLRLLLGLATGKTDGPGYVLMLRGQRRNLGVQVDSVEGVVSFSRDDAVSTKTNRFVSWKTSAAGMLLVVESILRAFEGES
jgi:purine-binding chemotaxis protein CheW